MITLSPDEAADLRALATRPGHPGRVALRARIVLALAAGAPAPRVAGEVGVSASTVRLWRSRFAAGGVAGLLDAPRPGRPRQSGAAAGPAIAAALARTPPGQRRWSLRTLSGETGIPVTTLHRACREQAIRWSDPPGTRRRPVARGARQAGGPAGGGSAAQLTAGSAR